MNSTSSRLPLEKMLGKLFSLFKNNSDDCNQLGEKLLQEDSEQQLIKPIQIHDPPQKQTLWALLPRHPDSPYLSFYDMCKKTTTQYFKLPEAVLAGGLCCCRGSGHGWLLLEILHKSRDHQIFLFNPISGCYIALPPFKLDSNQGDLHIDSVVLSVSPDAASYRVAAILNGDILAIWGGSYKEGWTILEGLIGDDDEFSYSEILLSSDGSALYASVLPINHKLPPRELQTHPIRLAGGHNIVLKIFSEFDPIHLNDPEEETPAIVNQSYLDQYLVGSSDGGLMLVNRWCDTQYTYYHDVDGLMKPKAETAYTAKIEVAKLDELSGQFSTLTDLGDQALFVSHGKSFIASIGDDDLNGLEKNCIYFLDDSAYDDEDKLLQQNCCQDSGVFSMKDAKIKFFLPSRDREKQCPFVWFSPDLNSGLDIGIVTL